MKNSQRKAMFARMYGFRHKTTGQFAVYHPFRSKADAEQTRKLQGWDAYEVVPIQVPSPRKFEALKKDEAMASKEYASYGYMGLSKDEARHKKFLEAEQRELARSDTFERCVRKVKAKQTDVNPWAVCRASMKRSKR